MTKSSAHFDEIFYDLEKNLNKTANTLKDKYNVFISETAYKNYLMRKSCEELKNHNPNQDHVPGEKVMIFNQVKSQKKCGQSDVAIKFAIKHISKIADDMDKNGFTEIANVLDEALNKFANIVNCKDCK